ncbi:hypothetical protein OEA41_009669 [Lepraria neglecta]|uniref:Uncharacterized protein n=1 Tax=Lepraria neglecta TaxID=209136 RepID=A0AAD9Z4R6_9LECA|nr:hypothetical protein OEA41_009669 [Lepraria neglecta]
MPLSNGEAAQRPSSVTVIWLGLLLKPVLDLVFVREVGDLADAMLVELNNVEDCTVEEFDPVFVEEISGLIGTVPIEPNEVEDSAALMFVPELVFDEEIVEIGAVVLVEFNKVEDGASNIYGFPHAFAFLQ